MSRFMWNDPATREIVAFVHIEKAAGTTLVNIFRREFNVRFCEVRPLERASGEEFTAEDMKKTLMINPFLVAITGHAVKPFTDLQDNYKGIRYITLLRDPVKRYVSHYQYWIEKMGKKLHFEEFLELEGMRNFQTRKIAGFEDVQRAKATLSEKFLLIGFVEQFDEFVAMLSRVSPYQLNLGYSQANKAKSKELANTLLAKYNEEILQRNRLDIELYDFAKKIIMPRQILNYSAGLEEDLPTRRNAKRNSENSPAGKYIYYLYKKLYFEPVTGLIRRLNGLPVKGSYGIEKKNNAQ